MNDTEYHAKIKRLPIGEIPRTRKPLMTEADMRELLTGEVWVEEKLDGTIWWQHISTVDYNVFWEDLRIRHSVFYDRLPAFYIVLDVAQGDGILPPYMKERFGIPAPVIDHDQGMMPEKFQARLEGYLHRISAFSSDSEIEGIVVKNYAKQLFGKVVNIEFYRGIEATGPYLKRRVVERNRLWPLYRNVRAGSFSL